MSTLGKVVLWSALFACVLFVWPSRMLADPILIAQWNFNEGTGSRVYDSTANHYDANIVQESGTPSWGSGCLSYQGHTIKHGRAEVVGMPSFSTLGSFSAVASFRITGQGYPNGSNPYYQHWLVDKWGSGDASDDEWTLGVTVDYHPFFQVCYTGGPTTTVAQMSGTIGLNEWHTLAGVFRSGSGVDLYLDGNLVASTATAATSVRNTGAKLMLGNVYYWGGDDTWNPLQGDLDYVQIYQGVLPEPGTVALLTLGGLALLRRRRN